MSIICAHKFTLCDETDHLLTIQTFPIHFKLKSPVSRATYTMLSGSAAHAPTAFVTFTRSAWFIPTRRFTRGWMPPHFRTMTWFSYSWQHSPKAPTTFTRTSSGWSVKSPTSVSMALYSRNLQFRERRLFVVQSQQKRYSENNSHSK